MKEKSPRGSQKYTTRYTLDIVGERHGLSTRRVKNIFWSPATYGFPDENSVGEPTATNI